MIVASGCTSVNRPSGIRYSSRSFSCRICGRTRDGDCRELPHNGTSLFLCRTGRGHDYNASGYIYTKDTTCGTWGIYIREEDFLQDQPSYRLQTGYRCSSGRQQTVREAVASEGTNEPVDNRLQVWLKGEAKKLQHLPPSCLQAEDWARELGLPSPTAFGQLEIYWLEHDSHNRGDVLCVPERDGQAHIIGYSRRYRTEAALPKKAVGKRSIIIPRELPEGTIYLVEGASDVLSHLTMGNAVLGRPSNTGGGQHLIDYLRRLPVDRPYEVVVIGEHDQKANGTWAGRSGAYRLAKQLADELTVDVRVAFPPEGHKDSRDWLRAQLAAGHSLSRCRVEWAAHVFHTADRQRPGEPLRFQDTPAAAAAASTSPAKPIDDLSDLGGERVGAAIAKARERGKLAEDRAEEATAKLVCDALLAAAKRCPNPGPPLHLKKPGKRAVMRRACEKPDCPVCREYLKTRALAVLSHHIHAAEARGEHLYLSQVDTDAAWRPAYYRMRRKGLTDYAVLRDRDADGRPCMTCIATGPPDAALGIRVSARQAIGQIRAAVEAWRGEADLIIHKSDSWPVSIYDRPGEWECLGYAGTHDRKMLLDIAETVAATVSVGDPLEMPHIAQWTGIELPESASTEDGAYLDYQLAVGKVVPRAMWEQSCRAPHYGEESPLPSPQSGAPSASPCAELGYGSGITPWG